MQSSSDNNLPASLSDAARQLENGQTSSRALTDAALNNIAVPDGEGERAFLEVYGDQARADAERWDALRSKGQIPSPYAGIPISIKDLFDDAGYVTRAGTLIMADDPPASRTNLAVSRLRKAGFVIVGRTNMTELAYSGLGMNPHYGTPLNPFERSARRIPGGSSSGAVVSVTDEMAMGGLGSDTGGSCRIPAALCGIVGFKPTQDRDLLAAMVPLSPTLDTVGCMAKTVECCQIMAGLFSNKDLGANGSAHSAVRLGVPQTVVFDGVSSYVMSCFEEAMKSLEAAGVRFTTAPKSLFDEIGSLSKHGGFPAGESYRKFKKLIEQHASGFDPRVKVRIEKGRPQSLADYKELQLSRTNIIQSYNEVMAQFDAVVFPTTPGIAPEISQMADDIAYDRTNLEFLRNSTLVNLVDGCAISIPIHRRGEAPVGMTIAASGHDDKKLLSLAGFAADIIDKRWMAA